MYLHSLNLSKYKHDCHLFSLDTFPRLDLEIMTWQNSNYRKGCQVWKSIQILVNMLWVPKINIVEIVPRPIQMIELLKEINERIEWLKEMDALGEGKKHRQVIDAQVTERLNEIRRLEEKLAKEKRYGLQDEKIENEN